MKISSDELSLILSKMLKGLKISINGDKDIKISYGRMITLFYVYEGFSEGRMILLPENRRTKAVQGMFLSKIPSLPSCIKMGSDKVVIDFNEILPFEKLDLSIKDVCIKDNEVLVSI
ncbi:MAG: hypothetical protein R6W70_08750 [bacterium]